MRGVMGTPEAHNLRQEGSIPSPATKAGLDEQRMTAWKDKLEKGAQMESAG